MEAIPNMSLSEFSFYLEGLAAYHQATPTGSQWTSQDEEELDRMRENT